MSDPIPPEACDLGLRRQAFTPRGAGRTVRGGPARTARLSVLAAIAVAILLTTTASGGAAPTVLKKMTPPFGRYGGLVYSGNQTTVNIVHYSGFNRLLTAPTFNLSTGAVADNQTSLNQQGGTIGLASWAGVTNLTFQCKATCSTAGHRVSVLWNLSWASYVRSNCSHYYSAGTWARANVAIELLVYNTTGGVHVLSGRVLRTPDHQTLSTPGFYATASGARDYQFGVSIPLTYGGTYEFETLVLIHTWTHSLRGCGSYAGASIDPPSGSSALEWLQVY